MPNAQHTDPLALWIIPTGDLGGVARHVLDVADNGIPGWRIVFVVPEGPLFDILESNRNAVVRADFGPAHGIRKSAKSLHRLTATLRPDVVHSHLAYADFINAATPHTALRVSTEHGIAGDDLVYHGTRLRSRIRALAHRARLTRFDRLIAVSHATKRVMDHKWSPHAPVSVIHNGVDPTPGPPRSPGLRIASIARLAPEKRIDRLIEAFAALRGQHPEAELTVAGAGPLERELRDLAARLGVPVAFPGHVDAAALLQQVDVLAQLSVFENCSYSLLDAVAAGCGVVATPVGGNPEILPERCLVETDSIDVLAEALAHQGLALTDRPRLPADWPTVPDMCAAIGASYSASRDTLDD